MNTVSVHEVLLAASIGRGNGRIRDAAERMVRSDRERQCLFSAAGQCDASAALMEFLSGIGILVPHDESGIREETAREFAVTDSMNATAGDVFRALDEAGIPFVPLKGADPRLKNGPRGIVNPMDDVDVLVRGEDAETAACTLERAGFRFIGAFSGAHMNFVSNDTRHHAVEVHWDLVNREDPVQSALFTPNMTRIWERTENAGRRICLGREDCLCYFAAHAVKEYFRRPKWLADIAFMLEETDWGGSDAARRIAEEWGVRPSLGFIVSVLVEITGDIRFSRAFGSCALNPGLIGKSLAVHVMKGGGLDRLRPLLWLAAARSPERVSAVVGGMTVAVVRKITHRKRMRRS